MPGDDYAIDFDPDEYEFNAQGWTAATAGRPARRPFDPQPIAENPSGEVARYRALPVGTRDQLKTLITEKSPTLVDGRDVQFWGMSNADVGSLMYELTGDKFTQVALNSESACELSSTGWRGHRTLGLHYGGPRPTERSVIHTHAGPTQRYTARTRTKDLLGSHSKVRRHTSTCTDQFFTYGSGEFDPASISDLRAVYQHVMHYKQLARERAEADRQEKVTVFLIRLGALATVLLIITAIVVFATL